MKPLRILQVGALLVLGSVFFTRPAEAHHSFSMYDSALLVDVSGVVKEFQWTNPHAIVWIYRDNDAGAQDLWTIELPTSPGNLQRMGWNRRSLKPGDHVVIQINPLRDQRHGGSFKKVTYADGSVLTASAVPPDGGAEEEEPQDSAGEAQTKKKGGICSATGGPVESSSGWIAWFLLLPASALLRRQGGTRPRPRFDA
jgi:Family of unknown function (DUF6152)